MGRGSSSGVVSKKMIGVTEGGANLSVRFKEKRLAKEGKKKAGKGGNGFI